MKNRIIKAIKKQLKEARAKGIVMGLSGGVDSGVVAALAKQAVGRNRLLVLILPCHSQRQDTRDARLVARKIGIKTKLIDLSQVYDSLIKILPRAKAMVQANLKPRLRMLVLYYFANKLNYIVCGTGNKSEIKVGYFTKYGDGAADIFPIGNLLKRQVRALAGELGIPQKVIIKPPTAGLWLDQTDEGEMGITYNILDSILERLEKGKIQLKPALLVKKVKAMIERSEHKRQMPKICS